MIREFLEDIWYEICMWPFYVWNVFFKNPRCCQQAYCKRWVPDDYARGCNSCDPVDLHIPDEEG